MISKLFTIGHSTRTLADLIETLHAHSIKTLVDIRAFPASRRLPHFNRESLERGLPLAGIEYVWMRELGGHRKKTRTDSPNTALRNASFRNYGDYMLTHEFKAAVRKLLMFGEKSPTAYMCAERVYFRCHRMLVSDYLVAHGHPVLHIDGIGPTRPHKLTAEARLVGEDLIYEMGSSRSLF